jgi:hypothetical protein
VTDGSGEAGRQIARELCGRVEGLRMIECALAAETDDGFARCRSAEFMNFY